MKGPLLLSAAALLTTAAPVAQRGESVRCVSDRAHLLRYDILGEENDGTSYEGIERAVVTFQRSSVHDQHCRNNTRLGFNPSGDKVYCFGANQDASCKQAKTDVPIDKYFDCRDCFVSVSADTWYRLDYSAVKMHSLAVGLNDTHVYAAASLHKKLHGQGKPVVGSIPLIANENFTIIDELVGCPVCLKVKIQVSAPTSIDYSMEASADLDDLQAGVLLDIDLGNNFVAYDSTAGWSHVTHQPTVKATPLLAATGNADAKFTFGLMTKLRVNVDDFFWYSLTLNPSIPGALALSGHFWPFASGDLCLDGTAKFEMVQEADLNWHLLVWSAVDHWGPSNLWSWALPDKDKVHVCKHFGTAAITV